MQSTSELNTGCSLTLQLRLSRSVTTKTYVWLETLFTEPIDMQFAETVLQGYPDTEPERLVVELAMAKQQKWDMLSVSAVADKLRHVEPAVRTQQHV